MKQAEAFLFGEGDKWYDRNKDAKLNYTIVDTLCGLDPKPNSILEVGCGNARYLGELHRYFGGRCVGIDASNQAILQGRQDHPSLILKHNMALPGIRREWAIGQEYDLIVFGFCLYLLDRKDLLMAVAYTDALVKEDGCIAIHDFAPARPIVVPYKHKKGVCSYKMDYPALWLANPAYTLVTKVKTAEGEAITIIRKTGWDKL
jgi:SAM-dependent methyltransferase